MSEKIQSRVSTAAYAEGWERIFRQLRLDTDKEKQDEQRKTPESVPGSSPVHSGQQENTEGSGNKHGRHRRNRVEGKARKASV